MWLQWCICCVKGKITVTVANNRDRKNRSLAFKKNDPFIACISKINNVLMDNAKDLDVAMPMCTIWGLNTVRTTERKQVLYGIIRDELNNPSADNYNADPITNSASFKYKNSIIGKTPNNDNDDNETKDVEIVAPLR